MLSRWSIQYKLLLCVAIFLLILAALAYSGFSGAYGYRQLARTISQRAGELPLAGELSKSLGDLRVTLSRARQAHELTIGGPISHVEGGVLSGEFRDKLLAVEGALSRYRKELNKGLPTDPWFGDRSYETKTIETLERSYAELARLKDGPDWLLDEFRVVAVADQVETMHDLAGTLPQQLHKRMHEFATDVKSQYRTWIYVEWGAIAVAVLFVPLVLFLFYTWVVAPLHLLIAGSRRIAQQDDFDHRIYLRSRDEMAELATALNDMTARFQQIRSDLDQQVRERTKEVVRGEQMASVGFLAAGVAHEINNPLAAIAMSAESLESRLFDLLNCDEADLTAEQQSEVEILRKYLRRIQDEAFRCKGITERLLDFSRLGDVEKQDTDLREVLEGVIDMVQHLGKYKGKHIELSGAEHVVARVNSQEIKQVALNLVTNALDSLDPGGTVWITLKRLTTSAELVVRDNGCGMTGEVLKHLFEPFFTRRRDGSGTGLGLSITYRIVTDHGGTIEPASDGQGRGSRMRVLLPLSAPEKATHERSTEKRLQAA